MGHSGFAVTEPRKDLGLAFCFTTEFLCKLGQVGTTRHPLELLFHHMDMAAPPLYPPYRPSCGNFTG